MLKFYYNIHVQWIVQAVIKQRLHFDEDTYKV